MKHFSPDIPVTKEGFGQLSGVGIGLKPQHYQEILETRPGFGWFEVHAENYMGQGGAPHYYLGEIARQYPLSFHGVGLSIGGVEPLDKAHLQRLKILNDRYHPALFSEHLAWSGHGGKFLNDLLPLPYTKQTLASVCDHISQLQDVLGRQILLENPSTYICYADNSFSEPDFLAELSGKTGCGLLLDINNVYVSAENNGFDPRSFIDDFALSAVKEIHLAGHAVEHHQAKGGERQVLRIDDHGSPVCPDVWQLYQYTLSRAGAVPTLIERDNNIPPLAELVAEAGVAASFLKQGELSNVS